MDILGILNQEGTELYPEDLAFFDTELLTGDYPSPYIQQCRERMSEIRHRQSACPNGATAQADPPVRPGGTGRVQVPLSDLQSTAGSAPNEHTAASLKADLNEMRLLSKYKSTFKAFAEVSDWLDEAFVTAHMELFLPWELNAMIRIKAFSEPFLERYFSLLNPDYVARYQLFSESFFMRHYAEMKADLVLLRGRNSWRHKQNRSKQLDVFLRLKGVKL